MNDKSAPLSGAEWIDQELGSAEPATRLPPDASQAPPVHYHPATPERYVACATTAPGSAWHVDLWLAGGLYDSINYSFIINLPATSTQLTIMASNCRIEMQGQGMLAIRERLLRREAMALRQFDPQRWPGNPSEGEPVIHSMQVEYFREA